VKAVQTNEEDVVKAEAQARPLQNKQKDMTASEMLAATDEADELLKTAKESSAEAKVKIDALSEEVDAELQVFVKGEQGKLKVKAGMVEKRATFVSSLLVKIRDEAAKKNAAELSKLRSEALAVIHYHQKEKALTGADLFAEFHSKSKDVITEKEFLKFFKTCERKPKDEEADASGPSPEDLSRVFKDVAEESSSISKEVFLRVVRIYMKVLKESVITEGISIKDSKTLRRLELNEVVEVVEGPKKEDKADVMRIRVKVMKDDIEGWITPVGNQGTVFLEEGAHTWKVVKETIMTESFSLSGDGASKKLKDDTRKLKVNELVEVRDWPKKDESGCMRMQVKAKSDGQVGWVTMMGNAGNVFLEVV